MKQQQQQFKANKQWNEELVHWKENIMGKPAAT